MLDAAARSPDPAVCPFFRFELDGDLVAPLPTPDDGNRCAAIGAPRPQSAQAAGARVPARRPHRLPALPQGHRGAPGSGRRRTARPTSRGRRVAALLILVLSAGISFGFVVQRGGIELPAAAAAPTSSAIALAPSPSPEPSLDPVIEPSIAPSEAPSVEASSSAPSLAPTASAEASPSPSPSPPSPSPSPTVAPTTAPTATPDRRRRRPSRRRSRPATATSSSTRARTSRSAGSTSSARATTCTASRTTSGSR